MRNNVIDISDMTNEIGNGILDFNVAQTIEEETYEKTIEIPTRYMNKARVTVNIPYLLSKTAKESVKVALRNFNVNISEPHFIICELPNDECICLDPNKNLQSYNINDDCFFSVLPQTHSVRFESSFCNKESMEIDLSLTVADVVKQYLQQYKVEITHDYTISYEEDDEYIILTRDEIFGSCFIPSRTFRVFRRYFNFTREDLASEDLAKQAYDSILNSIPYMSLFPTDEQIQDLAFFTYLIDYNNSKLANMPSDVINFLPQAKSIEKYRKSIVRNYSRLKIPNRINCYRNWIRVMRSIAGFGAYIEYAHITQDPSGKRRSQQCTAIANPIEIIFATQKCLKIRSDSENYCYRIAFMNLKSVKLDYREVILTYYDKNKEEMTITAKFQDDIISDEFYTYVSENHTIIRKIFQNRAERKAKGEMIEFSSSFEKINLKTISKISSTYVQNFSYDRDFTGRQLAEKAAINLQLIREGERNHPEYAVLVIKSTTEYEWLDLDKKLYEQEIFDNYIILIVNPITLIKFHNGSSAKTLKIDLHMKIEDIIKHFMAKLGLPVLDGYALYYQDDDKKIPLNPEYYIPGQCDNYKELWFQRRLYMITNELANSRTLRYQSVNDCMSYLLNNETTMTLKQAIDLAIMYRYATTTDADEVRKDDGSTVNAYIPKSVIEKNGLQNVKKAYVDAVQSSPKLSNLAASRRYIDLARHIPEFGSEVFDVKFSEPNSKQEPIIPGTLYVSPKSITICKRGVKMSDGLKIKFTQIRKQKAFPDILDLWYVDESASKMRDNRNDNRITIKALSSPSGNPAQYIETLIIDSQMYFKKQRRIRKLEKQMEPTVAAQHISGKFVDDQGNIHPPEIDFFVGQDLNCPNGLDKVWFPLSFTQKQVIDKCREVLGLNNRKEEFIPLFIIEGRPKYLKSDTMTLKELNITRPAYVFLSPRQISINVTYNLETKEFLVDTTWKVKEFISKCCADWNIIDPLNYCLVSKAENRTLMRVNAMISEQINMNTDLLLRRQNFYFQNGLTKQIAQVVYKDCANCFSNQTINLFLIEDIVKAVCLRCIADKGGMITDIPSTLKNMAPGDLTSKDYDKKIVKDFLQKYNFVDTETAIYDFVNFVTSLPSFCIEQFSGLFNGRTGVECWIMLDKTSIIFVTKEKPYKPLMTIKWTQVIKFTTIPNSVKQYDECTMTYCGEDNVQKDQMFTIENIDYLERGIKCRSEEWVSSFDIPDDLSYKTIDPNYSVQVHTMYILETRSDEKGKKVMFDLRMNKSQIIETAIHAFGLNESNFEVFISMSSSLTKPFDDKRLLGTYYINKYTTILLISKLREIHVKSEDGRCASLTVSLTDKVHELIKPIANALGIYYDLGCHLFTNRPNGELVPLDFRESIITQVRDCDKFILKRICYALTPFDLRDEIVVNEIFAFVKNDLFSGNYEITTNQLIHFMIYLCLVECKTRDKFREFYLDKPEMYVPKNFDLSDTDIVKIFNETKQSIPFIDPLLAMQKFIIEAFKIPNFGVYQQNVGISYIEDANVKERPSCVLQISANGLNIINKITQVEFSAFKLTWDNVLSIKPSKTMIQVEIVLPGTKVYYEVKIKTDNIKSDILKQIEFLLFMYKMVFYPKMKDRQVYQEKFYSIVDNLNIENTNQKIIINMLPRIGSTNIIAQSVLLSTNGVMIKELLGNAFCFKDAMSMHILVQHRSDMSFQLMSDEQTILDIGAAQYDIFYLIDLEPQLYIRFSSGDRVRDIVKLFLPVGDLVFNILNLHKNSYSYGFSMFANKDGKLLPLDHQAPLLHQLNFVNDIVIDQRVFLFSDRCFEDEASLNFIFESLYHLFRIGKIQNLTIDLIKTLTVLSLFVFFGPWTNEFNIDIVKQYLPMNEQEKMEKETAYILKEYILISKACEKEKAMFKFIYLVLGIPDFGSEEYKCFVNNGSINSECILHYTPYNLYIREISTSNDLLNIPMETIKSFDIYGDIFSFKYEDPNDNEKILQFSVQVDCPPIIGTYFQIYLNLNNNSIFFTNINDLLSYIKSLEENGIKELDQQSAPAIVSAPMILEPDIDEPKLEIFHEQTTVNVPEIGDFANLDLATTLASQFKTTATRNNIISEFDLGMQQPLQTDFMWMLDVESLGLMRIIHTLSALRMIITLTRDNIFANDQETFIKKLNLMINIIKKDYPCVNNSLLHTFDGLIDGIKHLTEYISSNQFFDNEIATKNLNEIITLINLFYGEIESNILSKQQAILSQNFSRFSPNKIYLFQMISDMMDTLETLIEAYEQTAEELIIHEIDASPIVSKLMEINTNNISIICNYIKQNHFMILNNKLVPNLKELEQFMQQINDFNMMCSDKGINMMNHIMFFNHINDMLVCSESLISNCMTDKDKGQGESKYISLLLSIIDLQTQANNAYTSAIDYSDNEIAFISLSLNIYSNCIDLLHDADIFNDVISNSQICQSMYYAMISNQIMISKIYSKQGMEQSKDHFVKSAKEFETHYFSMSTINITSDNLKQILSIIDSVLIEQKTSNFDSVLRESKFIIESAIKSQNEMNPLDELLLEQVQMQLIHIYQSINQDSDKINPLTNNIELLKVTVLNSLIDTPSIYPLSKLSHLRTFYEFVQSIEIMIKNTVNDVKLKFSAKHQTVEKINEFLNFYFQSVKIRDDFNRDPFNKGTINSALELLNEIKGNDIKQVFAEFGLSQFSNLIIDIENFIEKCQNEFENVKPIDIQMPINLPTKEVAEECCNAVRLYQAVIARSSARSELFNDAKNAELLKEENGKIQEVCNNLLLQESFQTIKLYEYVKNFLEHIEELIKNVGSEIFEKETMPAMSVIKSELSRHINPDPPDIDNIIKYSDSLSDRIERTHKLIVSENDSYLLEDFCQQFGKFKDKVILVLNQISLSKNVSEYLIGTRFSLISFSKMIDMFLMRENVTEFQELMIQLNDLQIMIQNIVGMINSIDLVHFHSKEIEARSIVEVIDVDMISIFVASQFINFSKSLALLSKLPDFTFSPLLKYQFELIKDKVVYLSTLSYNDPQTVIHTLDGMDLNEILLFVRSISPLSHNPKLLNTFTTITNNLKSFKQYCDHGRLGDKSIFEYKQSIQNFGQFITDPMLRHYFNELLRSNDSLLFQQFTNTTALILEDEIPKSFHTNMDQNARVALLNIYRKTLQFSSISLHKTMFTSPFYLSNDSPLCKYAKEFFSNPYNEIDTSKVIYLISEAKNLPIFISSELETLKNINSMSNTLPLIRALSSLTDQSQFVAFSQKMLIISYEKCKTSLLNMSNILQNADNKIKTDGQQHDQFLRSLLESTRNASSRWCIIKIDYAKDVISLLKTIKLIQLKLPLIYLYSSYDPSISQILNNSLMIEFFQSCIELFNSFYNMFYNLIIEFFHSLESAKCITGNQLSLISKLCQTFACSKRLTSISFIEAHEIYIEMKTFKEQIYQQVIEKITNREIYLKAAADFDLIVGAMEAFDSLETLNPKIVLQVNSMYGFFLMSSVPTLETIEQKKYYVDLSISCINSMIIFSKNQGMDSFIQMIDYMKSMRDFIYSSDFAEKVNDYCDGTGKGFNAIIDICRREISGEDLGQFAELQRL